MTDNATAPAADETFLRAVQNPDTWYRRSLRQFRAGAVFVAHLEALSQPMTRETRSTILRAAEALEVKTRLENRGRGCRNGIVSGIGIELLKVLLRFGGTSGLTYPCYDTLMRASGLSRSAVADAIARLEHVGLIVVTRRLIRTVVAGVAVTRQGSNVYRFRMPAADAAARLPLPAGRRTHWRRAMAAVKAACDASTKAAAVAAEKSSQGPSSPERRYQSSGLNPKTFNEFPEVSASTPKGLAAALKAMMASVAARQAMITS